MMTEMLRYLVVVSVAFIPLAAFAGGREGHTCLDCDAKSAPSSTTSPDGPTTQGINSSSPSSSDDDTTYDSDPPAEPDIYYTSDSIHRSWEPHAEGTTRIVRRRGPMPPRDQRWDDIPIDDPGPISIQLGDDPSPDEERAVQYDRQQAASPVDPDFCFFICGNSATDRMLRGFLFGNGECTASNDFCGQGDSQPTPLDNIGEKIADKMPTPLAREHMKEVVKLMSETYRLAANPSRSPQYLEQRARAAVPRVLGGDAARLVDFVTGPLKSFSDVKDKLGIVYKLDQGEAP